MNLRISHRRHPLLQSDIFKIQYISGPNPVMEISTHFVKLNK